MINKRNGVKMVNAAALKEEEEEEEGEEEDGKEEAADANEDYERVHGLHVHSGNKLGNDSNYSTNEVSDLERIRLENIRRNDAFLADMGIHQVKDTISTEANALKAARRKLVRVERKPTPAEPAVVRRSSRVTIEKLKQEINELIKTGDAASLESIKDAQSRLDTIAARESAYSVVGADEIGSYSEATSRIEEEHFPMVPLWNAKSVLSEDVPESEQEYWNREVFKLLEDHTVTTPQKKLKREVHPPDVDTEGGMATKYSSLSVAERDVAKLTEARITATAFIPVDDN
jgi:hypothetical protein